MGMVQVSALAEQKQKIKRIIIQKHVNTDTSKMFFSFPWLTKNVYYRIFLIRFYLLSALCIANYAADVVCCFVNLFSVAWQELPTALTKS